MALMPLDARTADCRQVGAEPPTWRARQGLGALSFPGFTGPEKMAGLYGWPLVRLSCSMGEYLRWAWRARSSAVEAA